MTPTFAGAGNAGLALPEKGPRPRLEEIEVLKSQEREKLKENKNNGRRAILLQCGGQAFSCLVMAVPEAMHPVSSPDLLRMLCLSGV